MDNEATPPQSLKDVLSEKYDELAAEAESTETQVPDSEPIIHDENSLADSQTSEVQEGPNRDPSTGKFVSKSKVNSETQEVAPVEDVAAERPPVSWSRDSAELFKQLPPAVRSEIIAKETKREQIWNQIQRDYSNFESNYGQIAQAVEPYLANWNKHGVGAGQMISHLLAWNDAVINDPKAAIREIMQNRGISPEELFQDESAVDPRVAQMQAEINQLKGYLSNQEQGSNQYYHQEVTNMIESFASERDAQGNLARPHFQALYDQGYLTPIAKTLRDANPDASEWDVLNKAYEIAAYSNPQTRQALIEATQAKRVSEMRAKTQSARLAASSVGGAPAGNVADTQSTGKSLRELLSEKYDEMTNGASY